ncbi:ribbon-helix-helix protein, CopG family [Sulfolobus acidocaldarius]|uniref:ribbon-helix-helix protein, CopG family n=1 Tax=Sulfolobus acidocaldarius TaxID=2285 RepID=UPI0012D989E3|nr:ribbon-helix-helix protein, CopG family [Sulfolobus acidocaldarius]
MRIISITIDEDLLEQLETFAIKYKLSRSSAIRLAVKKMLEEGGGNENDYN